MATYSDIQICNIALHAVGGAAIETLSDDTKGARACSSFFNITRDYMLAEFDWGFARKYQVLTAIEAPTEEVPDGMCVYQLPADCEIPRKLWPHKQREYWEVVGDKLYCKRPEEVGLFYTREVTNTRLFSTAFSNTLAMGIAVRLAPILAQDDELALTLYQQFNLDKAAAQAIDANANNTYREYDETPENDTFVNPDLAGYLGYPVDGYT